MAGQLTFTSSPATRSEVPWIRRAINSLPVPLSPWTRTATFVFATISNLRRITCISVVRPKMTSTGERSSCVSCSEKRTVVIFSCRRLLASSPETGQSIRRATNLLHLGYLRIKHVGYQIKPSRGGSQASKLPPDKTYSLFHVYFFPT